jgi:signal peptidase I
VVYLILGEYRLVARRPNISANSILPRLWQETCVRGNVLNLKVVSGSMAPLIRLGDVVKVSHVPICRIKAGDIVAFIDRDDVVIHRIISIHQSGGQLGFLQGGDAGGFSKPVAPSDIIGKVFSIEKQERCISLDRPWFRLIGSIMASRSRFREYLHHIRPAFLGFILRYSLRPLWKLGRDLFFHYA